MPTSTEQQLVADILYQAFLVDLVAELEAQKLLDDENSEESDDSDDNDINMNSSSKSSDFFETSSSDNSENDEPTAVETYVEHMAQFYLEHYLEECHPISKSQEFKKMILGIYKHEHPEIFQSYFHVTVPCFDTLVSVLGDDPIFHNNSQNEQMPIAEQLAITLYCFGHYGNTASVKKVALLFGVGYGTVKLVTAHVLKVCCSEQFQLTSIQWASEATKENAKT